MVSSQTLGGWHEVSLEAAGGVVRVQRNALEVLSLAPAVPGTSVHGHPSGAGRSSGGSHRASTLGAAARGSSSTAAAARASGASGGASAADPRAATGSGGGRDHGPDGGGGGDVSSRAPLSSDGDVGLPADGGTSSQRPAGGKRKRSAPAAASRERSSPGGLLRSGGSGSGSGGATGATRGTVANFDALQYDSLKRYRAAYGLNVDVDCSRDELVRAVRRHFASSSVDELQVISDFLRRVRHCSSPAL